MDFRDTAIGTVARFISTATGRDLIVDDAVHGRVTITAPEEVDPGDAYAAFESVLAARGFIAVPAGPATKILPRSSLAPRPPRMPGESASTGAETPDLIAHLARVHHVVASTLVDILKPLASQHGRLEILPTGRTLLIIDTAVNVEHLLAIVRHLDVDRTRETLDVVPLARRDAGEIASTLNAVLPECNGRAGAASGTQAPSCIEVVAERRSHSVLVRATADQLPQIRALIEQLDRPPPGAVGRLNGYRLDHADARLVGRTVETLLSIDAGTDLTGDTGAAPDRHDIRRRAGAPESGPPLIARPDPGTSPLAAEPAHAGIDARGGSGVRITPWLLANALLVDSSPQDFRVLARLLRHLDTPRPWITIDVILMHADTETTRRMGLAFPSSHDADPGAALTLFSPPSDELPAADPLRLPNLIAAAARDRTVRWADGSELPGRVALARALRANPEVNVLATSRILTTDGEEAEILVPGSSKRHGALVIDTTVRESSSSTPGTPGIAITLNILPQLTENATVRISLVAQFPSMTDAPPGSPDQTADRPAEAPQPSTAVVRTASGETVAVGKLLARPAEHSRRGTTYLSSIPVLGRVFSTPHAEQAPSALIIFLTPRILTAQNPLADDAVGTDPNLAPVPIAHLSPRQVALIAAALPRADDEADEGPVPELVERSRSGSSEGAPADWEVQAGASRNAARAETIVQRLSVKGYRAFILRAEDAGDGWYRVRIGGLRTREEAQNLAHELASEGFAGAFVPRQ